MNTKTHTEGSRKTKVLSSPYYDVSLVLGTGGVVGGVQKWKRWFWHQGALRLAGETRLVHETILIS